MYYILKYFLILAGVLVLIPYASILMYRFDSTSQYLSILLISAGVLVLDKNSYTERKDVLISITYTNIKFITVAVTNKT